MTFSFMIRNGLSVIIAFSQWSSFQLVYYNVRQFRRTQKEEHQKFNKDSRTANFLQTLSIRIVSRQDIAYSVEKFGKISPYVLFCFRSAEV
jgi:hypothetical protein